MQKRRPGGKKTLSQPHALLGPIRTDDDDDADDDDDNDDNDIDDHDDHDDDDDDDDTVLSRPE